jgi:hypothetical protein
MISSVEIYPIHFLAKAINVEKKKKKKLLLTNFWINSSTKCPRIAISDWPYLMDLCLLFSIHFCRILFIIFKYNHNLYRRACAKRTTIYPSSHTLFLIFLVGNSYDFRNHFRFLCLKFVWPCDFAK